MKVLQEVLLDGEFKGNHFDGDNNQYTGQRTRVQRGVIMIMWSMI